jgi:iron complex outermembrane receptor protein
MGSTIHRDFHHDHGGRSPRISILLTIALACAAAGPVAAQEGLEEVVVTGTRIQRSGMTTATPVTVIDSQELDRIAPGTIIDGMVLLPQYLGSETPNGVGEGNTWFTRAGYGMLNLRGLGVNRTLTLLNGRKIPGTVTLSHQR